MVRKIPSPPPPVSPVFKPEEWSMPVVREIPSPPPPVSPVFEPGELYMPVLPRPWPKAARGTIKTITSKQTTSEQATTKSQLRAALRERDELERRLKELDAKLSLDCEAWGKARGMRGYAPKHLRAEVLLLEDDE